MFDPRLEDLAEKVRRAAAVRSVPVALAQIAAYDDIVLEPVTHHAGFHGKIEFLEEENTFVIYHPDPETYPYPTRLRFSIAHELAHFHIDEHRHALIRGETHSSAPSFRSKNPREIEADEFAAALLIPQHLMAPRIEKRGFLTLEEICKIATECHTSRHATAIRYVRMASEACFAVLAHCGEIQWRFPSDEAQLIGLGKIEALPSISPGHSKVCTLAAGAIHSLPHSLESRGGRGTTRDVWESCIHLGENYTLSLFSLDK